MKNHKGVLSVDMLRELNKRIKPRRARMRLGLEIDKLSTIMPPSDRYMCSMPIVMEMMERFNEL